MGVVLFISKSGFHSNRGNCGCKRKFIVIVNLVWAMIFPLFDIKGFPRKFGLLDLFIAYDYFSNCLLLFYHVHTQLRERDVEDSIPTSDIRA